MKPQIIKIAFLLFFCSTVTFAQAQNRERLDAYKIAFLTRRLDLNSAEAQKFWPLYNEYQKEKMDIQQKRARLIRQFNLESDNMSEKELDNASDSLIELQVAETELAVKFHKSVKNVLPPQKVFRFYQSENQYRLILLDQIREREPRRDVIRDRNARNRDIN